MIGFNYDKSGMTHKLLWFYIAIAGYGAWRLWSGGWHWPIFALTLITVIGAFGIRREL